MTPQPVPVSCLSRSSLEYHAIIADLFLPHVLTEVSSPPPRSFEETVILANTHMETLTRLYYLRHSFDTFDAFLTTSIVRHLSATITHLSLPLELARRLRLPTEETLRSALVLYTVGLCAQAKNTYICTLIYLGLQSLIRPVDLQLLLRYVVPPMEEEMLPKVPRAITSWPLPICRMNQDPKKAALNRMVSEYERMTTGPRKASEGGILSERAEAESTQQLHMV